MPLHNSLSCIQDRSGFFWRFLKPNPHINFYRGREPNRRLRALYSHQVSTLFRLHHQNFQQFNHALFSFSSICAFRYVTHFSKIDLSCHK